MSEKAKWVISSGEFHELYVARLRNGMWVQTEENMQSSGKWERICEFISEQKAARLLMEVDEAYLSEAGLDKWKIAERSNDNKETVQAPKGWDKV